jgi:hypothetical protein
MIPNPKNFCGGNFQDWLEINLTDKCNGKCSWCIENDGFHPHYHAEWYEIALMALNSKKKNIILLGGEPTLYPHLRDIIRMLSYDNRNVFITTNGSLLSEEFIENTLPGICGINISIHDSDLIKNKKITGIMINEMPRIINAIYGIGSSIRLNCNCISGHVDSEEKVLEYLRWAKSLYIKSVRFSELKCDNNLFVDLAKIFDYKHGLNDDPFTHGCHNDVNINGVNVNFRQMCGLQTSKRKRPTHPQQCYKNVLYYDGKIYKGWQKVIIEDRYTYPKELSTETSSPGCAY